MSVGERNLRKELETFCKVFTMQWRCEVSFDNDHTEQQAWFLVHRFLKELEEKLGGKDFCYVAWPERLHDNGSPLQVLIGGLRKCGTNQQVQWEEWWFEQSGYASISVFEPRYLKQYTPQDVSKIAYNFRFRSSVRAVTDVLSVAAE